MGMAKCTPSVKLNLGYSEKGKGRILWDGCPQLSKDLQLLGMLRCLGIINIASPPLTTTHIIHQMCMASSLTYSTSLRLNLKRYFLKQRPIIEFILRDLNQIWLKFKDNFITVLCTQNHVLFCL